MPWPDGMMKVDHERMTVPDGTMTVGMGMRLWPFPSFVFVRVMLVVNMQVFVGPGFMGVGHDKRISRGPQDERRTCCPKADGGQKCEGGLDTQIGAAPACQGIKKQPAEMRQGELGREHG